VVIDPATGGLDLDDGATPRTHAPAIRWSSFPTLGYGLAGIPENIVMLTADAFGVLPPISRSAPSRRCITSCPGYTARVAGTEKGVTEPQATFSTCFRRAVHAAPSHRLRQDAGREDGPPAREMLAGQHRLVGRRLRRRRAHVDPHTRAMVRAALDGTLAAAASSTDPHFGMQVPSACPTCRARC
jgi:phosphoenolpyruvate carboxykinase (ATP)